MHNILPPDTPMETVNDLLEKAILSLNEKKMGLTEQYLNLAHSIVKGLDKYTAENSTDESEQLRKLAELTLSTDWIDLHRRGITKDALTQVMLTGHLQGLFLKFIVSSLSAKRVLEIGMFSGYATLAMAEALPHDGEIITCEIDGYLAEFAHEYFKQTDCAHKIKIQLNPALETLTEIKNDNGRPFDFIFIDADKENYSNYYDYILDNNLLADSGLMCFDNTLMKGSVYSSHFEHAPLLRSV